MHEAIRLWHASGLAHEFPLLRVNASALGGPMAMFTTAKGAKTDSGMHHDKGSGVLLLISTPDLPCDGSKDFETYMHHKDMDGVLKEARHVPHKEFSAEDVKDAGEIVESFHMVAGCALYVPEGVIHRVFTSGQTLGLRFAVETAAI